MKLIVSKQGIYKIRFRINPKLQNYFNKKEINKSLGYYKAEAKLKALIIFAKYKQILKASSMLEKHHIQALVSKFITETLEQDLIDRAKTGQGAVLTTAYEDDPLRSTPALASAYAADLLISEYKEALSSANYSLVRDEVNGLLEANKITTDETSDSYRLLSYHLMHASILILEEVAHRGRGNTPEPPTAIINKLFKNGSLSPHALEPKKPIVTNKEALEAYISHYKRISTSRETSAAQISDVTNFLTDVLMELLDTDRDISETTLEDVLDTADTLKALPKRNIQKYRDMSISEILESEIPEADIISLRTATKQVKWVKSFYTYCNSKGWISGAIAQQVSITTNTNALDDRLSLELDEVLKLIDLLADNKPLQNLVKILYTSGMRLSEVYKCEVKEIDGIRVYDLTARDIKLKTKSSHRVIPVHSCVDTDLIKELSYPQQASKIINKLIREHISEDSRKVLYSLRHSFATILKHKGIQQEVIAELMGHTHSGMTFSRYADRYRVATLKGAIDTIEFPY